MNADTSEGLKELGGHEGLVTKALGEGRDGLAMNALEVSGRVMVVVMLEPPMTETESLTMMVIVLYAVAPASSVTVTVS